MSEFTPLNPLIEIIKDAQDFIVKHDNKNDPCAGLVEGYAREANTRVQEGTNVNLSIIPLNGELDQIDTRLARFKCFERTGGQPWYGVFDLIPDGIATLVPVDQFEVTEPQS